jgi:phosphoribosyl-ATP pyrophosphohydrolase/phosphoribosyl-AMP cyclohydrolase
MSALSADVARAVKWNDDGLVVAVAQDRLTGRVQMVAWMNAEALEATLRTRRATFWSRSRKALWTKGETSGNALDVESIALDCDGDAIVLLVEPHGPSCHTGEATCFFTRVDPSREPAGVDRAPVASPVLLELEREIASRKSSDASKSYTKSLLEKGVSAIGDKLREEADELARATAGEGEDRVAAEAADVVYHLLVALAARDVPLRRVLETLAARRGTSGHDEKAARRPKDPTG